MMLEAVETRFGWHRAPHPVEMLSDNGSAYTPRRPASSPASSPSGPASRREEPAEATASRRRFVRTLKRDYVQVTPLPNAEVVLALLPAWFADYNTNTNTNTGTPG
jgi:transposase InsO family protein